MSKAAALALTAFLSIAASGCVVHGNKPHPHGAPPGQVKKALYKCGTCGITQEAKGSCHGKVMILVP